MLIANTVAPKNLKKSNSRSSAVVSRQIVLAALLSSVVACSNPGILTTPTVEKVPATAMLSITKDIDLVRISGTFGSAEEIANINDRAAVIYGADMIINELTLVDSLPPADWIDSVLDSAGSIKHVDEFALAASDGHLRVGGNVASPEAALSISELLSSAAGESLAITSDLSFPQKGEALAAADPSAVANEPASGMFAAEASQSEALTATGDTTMPATSSAGTPAEPANKIVPIVAAVTTPSAVSNNLPATVIEQQAYNNGIDAAAPQVANATGLLDSLPDPQLAAAKSPAQWSGPIADDADGDGVIDHYDECESRAGYPVNVKGCQVLDGYLKNVRFYGKTDKLTRRAMQSLDNLATVMQKHPQSKIAVLSYTANSGSPWELRGQARDRARSVVGYLVNKGVEKNRLQAYAFGHMNGSGDQIMIKEVD